LVVVGAVLGWGDKVFDRGGDTVIAATLAAAPDVVDSSGTPHDVIGAIRDKWLRLGGEGFFGPATDVERPTFDGVGRAQSFAGGGIISWHPQTGAFAVWGQIGAKWVSLGREQYGYPISDERQAPDGRGRFNEFRTLHNGAEASIYWTPTTGAHEVRGAIRLLWAQRGWGQGSLGYPTSDEYPTGRGDERRSRFERGSISWTGARGAHVDGETQPIIVDRGSAGRPVRR
jgi:uncharacterized protein with LGFP repeats